MGGWGSNPQGARAEGLVQTLGPLAMALSATFGGSMPPAWSRRKRTRGQRVPTSNPASGIPGPERMLAGEPLPDKTLTHASPRLTAVSRFNLSAAVGPGRIPGSYVGPGPLDQRSGPRTGAGPLRIAGYSESRPSTITVSM